MSLPVLSFDLDRLVASRMLIQANSGGGKSRALRWLAEATHGQVQQIILDPEGEFASLREKFDSVLAGKDGDVPAHPDSAKLLCRRLLELRASAVIDLYDLKLPDRRRFVRSFLEELMHLPRSLWRPLIVVIDEAHVFAPERGQGDAESLDGVITLATQGRKRGYCLVAATQRLSKLHKDVAAELLNKLIGRTGLDVDVKRAADELGFDKEQRQSLKHMKPGSFYAYGPAISTSVELVRTGQVLTTHPEAGAIAAPAAPAPKAIQKLLSELQDLPAQAKEEARSISDLQREVRDLRAQLRKAERGGIVQTVEKPVRDEVAIRREVDRALAAQRKEYEQSRRNLSIGLKSTLKAADRLKELAAFNVESLTAALGQLDGVSSPETGIVYPIESERLVPPKRAAPAYAAPPRRMSAEPVDAGTLNSGQQRILNALAELEALGISRPTRGQVGVVAEYNLSGGTPARYVGALTAAGLVEMPETGKLELTDAGRSLARAPAAPLTIEDLHERVMRHLKDGPRRILAYLINVWPHEVSRTEVGEGVGYNLSGGTPARYVGVLTKLGFAEIPSNGQLRAGKLLFPEELYR